MLKVELDRAFLTLFAARALQFLIALVTLRSATTFLSPIEMGKVSLVLTTTAFFALFLINPAGMFINRRLHAWYRKGVAGRYLKYYPLYLVAVAIVAWISIYLLTKATNLSFGMPYGWIILLVCGSLIFNTINQTSIPSLNLLGDSSGFAVLTIATLVVSLILAVTLVWSIDPSAQFWILGLLMGQFFLAFAGVERLYSFLGASKKSEIEIEFNLASLKTLFNFGWPISLAAGLAWVQGQSYRYILGDESGLEILGLFAAGYGLSAGIISGFEGILTTYLQPKLYRDADIGNSRDYLLAWRRYANAMIPSVLMAVSLVIVISPELTNFLMGKNFRAASEYVLWGAVVELARVLTGVFSMAAHLQMRTSQLVFPSLAGALLAMGLSFYLVPILGTVGAGISLVFSGFTTTLLMYYFILSGPLKKIDWFNVLEKIFVVLIFWLLAGLVRLVFRSADFFDSIFIVFFIMIGFLALQYRLLRDYLRVAK